MRTEHKNEVEIKSSSQYMVVEEFRKKIPDILDAWINKALAEVQAAKSLNISDLKDSLPLFLETLATALEHGSALKSLELQVARQHGKVRSMSPQYTLEQTIFEYRLLRRIIFEVFGENITASQRDAIFDAIEIGISEAASEFTNQHFQLREQFVAMLAHDLRNPLSAIKSNAQLIQKYPEKVESINVMAGRIVNTVDRTDRMIKDLLDSNMILRGQKMPLSIQPCNFHKITKDCVDEATEIHGAHFLFYSEPVINGYWDPVLIQRSIGNLLTNAIKHGSKETPVSITITQKNTDVLVAVHNDGPPIPKEDQEIIFNNFYNIRKAHHDNLDGWGIGLYLVKAAMDAHGGSVEVQSNAKDGTTFTLTIPRDSRPYQQPEVFPPNTNSETIH